MSSSSNVVQVLGLKSSPILQLLVSRPGGVERALDVEGQSEVESFHLTLARLDDMGVSLRTDAVLPEPPAEIRLSESVALVESGKKKSCYQSVDARGQDALREYLRRCEAALGVSLLDKDRVFHVTLSNAGGGAVRASVGAVWEYPSTILDPALKQPTLSSKPGEDIRAAASQRFANSPLLKALHGDSKTLQSEDYDGPQADGSRVRKTRIF